MRLCLDSVPRGCGVAQGRTGHKAHLGALSKGFEVSRAWVQRRAFVRCSSQGMNMTEG